MTSTWIKIVKRIPSLVCLFFLSLTLKYHHLHFPCAMTWEVSCVRLKIKSRKRSSTTASSFKISNEHQSLWFWKKGLSYLLQMLKTKERSFHLQRYSVQFDSCTLLLYFRFNQPCLSLVLPVFPPLTLQQRDMYKGVILYTSHYTFHATPSQTACHSSSSCLLEFVCHGLQVEE